jgi:hypothetical protein
MHKLQLGILNKHCPNFDHLKRDTIGEAISFSEFN